MKRLVTLVSLLALAGCATARPEPQVRIQEVYIDRAVTCVPANLGTQPDYPDTDAALASAPDAAARYALIWAGRLLRAARLAETEPVIVTCREIAR